jgi:hypothetical protein
MILYHFWTPIMAHFVIRSPSVQGMIPYTIHSDYFNQIENFSENVPIGHVYLVHFRNKSGIQQFYTTTRMATGWVRRISMCLENETNPYPFDEIVQ